MIHPVDELGASGEKRVNSNVYFGMSKLNLIRGGFGTPETGKLVMSVWLHIQSRVEIYLCTEIPYVYIRCYKQFMACAQLYYQCTI